MNIEVLYYLIIVLLMSFLAFVLYFADKQKAKNNQWRIKESLLLTVGVLFGALGSLLAMYNLRHKNRKIYFVIINWGSLVLHIGVLIFLLIQGSA